VIKQKLQANWDGADNTRHNVQFPCFDVPSCRWWCILFRVGNL